MVSASIQILETEKKGRGMFANEFIKSDTIREISPVIVMPKSEQDMLEQTELRNYIFEWGEESDQCAMALGYISIYNHSAKNNCDYFMDFDDNIMFIKTLADVEPGSELTINYNGDAEGGKDVIWFDVLED